MDSAILKSRVEEVAQAIFNGEHRLMIGAFDGLCLLDGLQVALAAMDDPDVAFPDRVSNLLFDRLNPDYQISDPAYRALDTCQREAVSLSRLLGNVESNPDGSCEAVYRGLKNLQTSFSDTEVIAIVAIVASGNSSKRKLFSRHIQFCLENEHEINA